MNTIFLSIFWSHLNLWAHWICSERHEFWMNFNLFTIYSIRIHKYTRQSHRKNDSIELKYFIWESFFLLVSWVFWPRPKLAQVIWSLRKWAFYKIYGRNCLQELLDFMTFKASFYSFMGYVVNFRSSVNGADVFTSLWNNPKIIVPVQFCFNHLSLRATDWVKNKQRHGLTTEPKINSLTNGIWRLFFTPIRTPNESFHHHFV